MKWQAKEMDTYLQAKEYVDTAIIPLVPLSLEKDVKSTVAMGEFILIISGELERQFQGRVILFPAFSYLKKEPLLQRKDRLVTWFKELEENGMKHCFLLTSDSEWKTIEEQLEQSLIWLPSIPLEHMDMKYQMEVVNDQIKQLIPILTNKWQNR